MNSEQQTIETPPNCDLCQRKMNPTIHIYKQDTHLCNDCFSQLESVPLVVAKCVERFLIGDVV